jgi:hypothetical protein
MGKKPRRMPDPDLFRPPPIHELELIRRGYPELTRCVVCQELGSTRRWTVNDFEDERLVSYWTHRDCANGLIYFYREPKLEELQYQSHGRMPGGGWGIGGRGRIVQRAMAAMRERQASGERLRLSRPTVHTRCFYCERYERADHRAHRIGLGYSPKDPWLGRLEAGEIL